MTDVIPVGESPYAFLTAKERDSESNLDFFGARYFSGAQGRFTSPDAPFADQYASDPQSWNLYHYGRNNPLRFTDPTGRKCVDTRNGKADDGTGGGCPEAGVDEKGNIKPHQITVHADPLIDNLRFQLFRSEFNRANNLNVKAAGVVAVGSLLFGATGGTIAAGGSGLVTLGIGAGTRLVPLVPLIPPAGDKLSQIIARLGPAFRGNPQLAMQKLTELRDAAVQAGTHVQGFYIRANSTIYRVGNDFLTVGADNKVLSFVKNATPNEGVAQRYLELGGK
jgi:RHS repeat-associated protein